jgi:hypothetical protein
MEWIFMEEETIGLEKGKGNFCKSRVSLSQNVIDKKI